MNIYSFLFTKHECLGCVLKYVEYIEVVAILGHVINYVIILPV